VMRKISRGKKKSDNERNNSKFIRSHFSWEKNSIKFHL